MSRTVRKTNNGERSDKTAYTKNKKSRKWNKEKSIKLKNIDLDDINLIEVTKEELDSRRSSAYEYFKFDEDE